MLGHSFFPEVEHYSKLFFFSFSGCNAKIGLAMSRR